MGYLGLIQNESQAWYIQVLYQQLFTIYNSDQIVITEPRKRFLLPDLTLVQSEMVVLSVLGYSRTQHAAFHDDGVLSVSGHCHLGELYYES